MSLDELHCIFSISNNNNICIHALNVAIYYLRTVYVCLADTFYIIIIMGCTIM